MIIHVGKTMENNPPMTGNGKFIAPTKLQNGDDWPMAQMALWHWELPTFCM